MKQDISELTTLQEVEQLAAKKGIRFTKADYRAIRRAQEEARLGYEAERAAALEAGKTWADKFMLWYPKLLETIASAGNILTTFAQSIIVNLGVPVVLVLLLIVEQQRVYHGIELFETNAALASFAAWSMVVLNLVLEIIAHHVEYSKRYEAERSNRWSLRIALRNLGYRLGMGKGWQEQKLSPAQWAHSLLRIVTFTILSLALAGSMKAVIQQQAGSWYEALYSVVTQSSLLEIFTWAGGLMFAAAAVLSAQGLSRYVAIRTVEIRASMSSDDDLQEAIDQAAATAAYALLVNKTKGHEAVIVNPMHAPELISSNGASQNGHHRQSN